MLQVVFSLRDLINTLSLRHSELFNWIIDYYKIVSFTTYEPIEIANQMWFLVSGNQLFTLIRDKMHIYNNL